uniref:Uncharacterized protein n=2 Tax=Leersia perrieri TaxID=77586 RepID=A0A0D9VUX8_9ORYZ
MAAADILAVAAATAHPSLPRPPGSGGEDEELFAAGKLCYEAVDKMDEYVLSEIQSNLADYMSQEEKTRFMHLLKFYKVEVDRQKRNVRPLPLMSLNDLTTPHGTWNFHNYDTDLRLARQDDSNVHKLIVVRVVEPSADTRFIAPVLVQVKYKFPYILHCDGSNELQISRYHDEQHGLHWYKPGDGEMLYALQNDETYQEVCKICVYYSNVLNKMANMNYDMYAEAIDTYQLVFSTFGGIPIACYVDKIKLMHEALLWDDKNADLIASKDWLTTGSVKILVDLDLLLLKMSGYMQRVDGHYRFELSNLTTSGLEVHYLHHFADSISTYFFSEVLDRAKVLLVPERKIAADAGLAHLVRLHKMINPSRSKRWRLRSILNGFCVYVFYHIIYLGFDALIRATVKESFIFLGEICVWMIFLSFYLYMIYWWRTRKVRLYPIEPVFWVRDLRADIFQTFLHGFTRCLIEGIIKGNEEFWKIGYSKSKEEEQYGPLCPKKCFFSWPAIAGAHFIGAVVELVGSFLIEKFVGRALLEPIEI